MFDWLTFLTRYNIEHTSASRYHITVGNVGINCPLCPNDRTFNLHISLDGKGWHCFRVASHKGLTPQPLIQALLKCPFSFADSLVNRGVDKLPSDGDFLHSLTALFQPAPQEPREVIDLQLLKGFRPIRRVGHGKMFCSYLERRGFPADDVADLCKRYNLLCCADSSRWHGRIIFPVTIERKLLTWTGRHIGGSVIRYRTLSPSDSENPAVTGIKNTILWYDYLKHQTGTLVICEGPFDALKVAYLGLSQDIHATCLFGKSASINQCDLLMSLENFNRKILLLDSGTVDSLDPRSGFSSLRALGFETKFLPLEVSDPGEFDRGSFAGIFG